MAGDKVDCSYEIWRFEFLLVGLRELFSKRRYNVFRAVGALCNYFAFIAWGEYGMLTKC